LRAYVADVTREAESALSGVRPGLDALRAFTLNELYIAPYDLRPSPSSYRRPLRTTS